jgi:hypothetical protein
MRQNRINWSDPIAVKRHLASLTMDAQFDLMVMMGYQVHHLLPVDVFDLSRAFREYYEFIDPELRIHFNSEMPRGTTPEVAMENTLLVLQKRLIDGKWAYGVHTNHLDYTKGIARYLDLRETELGERISAEAADRGQILSDIEIRSLAMKALASEIPQITRILKQEILNQSVLEGANGYKEINELFGADVEKLSPEILRSRMNQFFSLK